MKQAQARNIWIAFSIVCFAGLFAATWAAQAVVGPFGAGTAFVVFLGLTAATIGLAGHRASLPGARSASSSRGC